MQENKIALIQVWIGKIPDYFWFHYETTKNLDWVHFYIFTDQNLDVDAKNYFINFITIEKLEQLLFEKCDRKVSVHNVKKVCDLKSSFGDLFQNYIEKYDYFGCYDIDTLFGDFNFFIKPVLNEYDVISIGGKVYHNRLSGPFLIMKNTEEFRTLYKSENFIQCMESEVLNSFEEQYLDKIVKGNYRFRIIDDINLEEENGGKNTYFVKWSAGKIHIQRKQKFVYHMYRKDTTLLKKVGKTIYGIYKKPLVEDFCWVVGFTKNYSENIEYLMDSIHYYSNRKCILYSINFDFIIPEKYLISNQFSVRKIEIPEGKKDRLGRDENIISSKPMIFSDVVNYLPDSKFVFIDSDVYLTINADDIVKYFSNYSNYPLINSHIHDRLYLKNIREGEEWTSTVDVLANVCGVEICVYPRRKTNVILFDKKSEWFFKEQIDLYQKYKDSEPGIFTFHDEDSANVILSKYKLPNSLHLCDIEGADNLDIEVFKNKNHPFHMTDISDNVKLPNHVNDIYFFHGVKTKSRYESIQKNYGDSVIDSEEFYITYQNNTLIFEKNSFLDTKKIPEVVNFQIKDMNENLIFNLENQQIKSFWFFFVSNLYLDKNFYKLEIYGSECKTKIFNNILDLNK